MAPRAWKIIAEFYQSQNNKKGGGSTSSGTRRGGGRSVLTKAPASVRLGADTSERLVLFVGWRCRAVLNQ